MLQWFDQLEIPLRRLIQHDVIGCSEVTDRRDLLEVTLLEILEVTDRCAGGADSLTQAGQTETVQIGDAEV